MTEARELVLVDGSSWLFRAFHALPALVNGRGQPTGAVKGIINMIRALIKTHDHGCIAIVFDAPGKTFRDEVYPQYKANRPPMPEELRSQIAPIHDIIRAMGLPLLIVDGVEADDVIGTLARQSSEQGIKTLISTGDKDLAQLVNEQVTLINTMTNELLDTEGVRRKFGVGPDRIVDWLALMGDKSDNIPGVPGVGPKTALKWLLEYDSMEGIIASKEAIGGKIGEKLRNNIEQLRLSHELATIKQDVKLDFAIADLKKQADDPQALYKLFARLEFKGWIRELEASGVTIDADQDGEAATVAPASPTSIAADAESELAVAAPQETDYRTVLERAQLEELGDHLRDTDRFSITIETEKAHFLDQKIFGMAVATGRGKAWYIPIQHRYPGLPPQLPVEEVMRVMKPVLENPAIIKAAYDLKQIGHGLRNYGVNLQPLKADVLLAAYVVNSVAKRTLPDLARRHVGLALRDLSELTGKGRSKLDAGEITIEDYAPWAAARADAVLRLASHLERMLAGDDKLLDLYRYYELPLIEVLQEIERNGIRVNAAVLAQQSAELSKRLDELEKAVHAAAGEAFNLSSPKQLQVILYDKLGLPVLRKTSTGQPTTAESVLLELAENYELPRLLLEHRSLNKLKSTYTDKLPQEINSVTGRIHSSFRQAVAATGRLSSTDPNLQNIPIRSAEGRRVRRAFVAEPGCKLLAADYSQVELRIMAHLSRDQRLLAAYSSDLDVHRATAAEVFNLPLEEVSAEQRRRAKAINFGLIYGMSAFGLAKQLGVERGEAQHYVDRYFEQYPGVRSYMDETRALAAEKGYVETLFGRRLYLPDIHAGKAAIRKAAERTAINAPMQGTAADIIKRAMIDIGHWLAQGELQARMLLQVHDELVFEVDEKDLELLAEGVRFRMISAASLDVPLVVQWGFGDNWDQAH